MNWVPAAVGTANVTVPLPLKAKVGAGFEGAPVLVIVSGPLTATALLKLAMLPSALIVARAGSRTRPP